MSRERMPDKCLDCEWYDKMFGWCRVKICKKEKDMLDYTIEAQEHLTRLKLIKEENK